MSLQSIRNMTSADIPAAEAILQAAHRMNISFEILLKRNLALTGHCWWVLEKDSQCIGVVGAVDYEEFAHIGLMAIHPESQVEGAGSMLLNHALVELERFGHKSITLYSTDAGLAFYPRHGFRWDGISTEWQFRKPVPHSSKHKISATTDFDRIAAWDAPLFGENRKRLLQALDQESPNRTFLAEDSSGNLAGFLIAQSAVIGPLAAYTPQAAADLIDHALTLNFDSSPRIILPEASGPNESLMIALGFTPLRTSRYFIRGQAPNQQRHLMYGQGAYSLG